MENINNEKDIKTEIKGKDRQFYIELPVPLGMLLMPSGTSKGKPDVFFDGIYPGAEFHTVSRGKLLLGCSGRRLTAKSPF